VVTGCLSQRYPEALSEELIEADGIVGNSDLALIPDAIKEILNGNRTVRVAPQPLSMPIPYYPRTTFFDYPGTAHIKITEGCSNHCSFCAIPLIRGELRSRPIDDIVGEAQNLIAQSKYELVLVGQDLGNYGKDLVGHCLLPELLEAIATLNAAFRVRVLYIHPDHFPYQILDCMKRDTRIVPYFDLPFQHASTSLLRKMNRRGTASDYLDLIASIRETLLMQ